MSDAFLVRSGFVLAGAAIGAIGSQSVIVLLHTWRLLRISPAASALASIGGACVFGALWFSLARVGLGEHAIMLTPARRRILIVALPSFLITTGFGLAIVNLISVSPALLRKMTLPGILGVGLFVHGVGAVVLVEVTRIMFPRMDRWSDRQHFAAVGVVWASLSMAGAVLLWRAWTKTWP